jgi:DUF4097 and DUF4098 domain-containing protein YvlB
VKRNVQFAMVVALALACLPLAAQNSKIYRQGDAWVEEISGTLPAARIVRVRTDMGAIHLQGGAADITYTVRKRVRTASEEQARRELAAFRVAASSRAGAAVLEGDAERGHNFRNISVDFQVNTPRQLELARAETEGGSISVRSLNARVETESGGGSVSLSDVSGSMSAETGGGSVSVENSSGALSLHTGGGSIRVTGTKGGKVVASSGGGSITVSSAQDAVSVETGGGSIDIKQCGADVRASTGGGSIDVGDVGGRANIETGGGSIRLTSARGPVVANTGGGSIQLYKLMSGARAETGAGSITAEFLGAATDSLLQTAVGDVVVYVGPQTKLTVRATIDMANGHSIRASDFPDIKITSEGGEWGPKSYSAQGNVNGGGPVLRIHTMTGNVEIRRAK